MISVKDTYNRFLTSAGAVSFSIKFKCRRITSAYIWADVFGKDLFRLKSISFVRLSFLFWLMINTYRPKWLKRKQMNFVTKQGRMFLVKLGDKNLRFHSIHFLNYFLFEYSNKIARTRKRKSIYGVFKSCHPL